MSDCPDCRGTGWDQSTTAGESCPFCLGSGNARPLARTWLEARQAAQKDRDGWRVRAERAEAEALNHQERANIAIKRMADAEGDLANTQGDPSAMGQGDCVGVGGEVVERVARALLATLGRSPKGGNWYRVAEVATGAIGGGK